MKRPWLRKLIGITGIIILFLLVAFFALLNNFTTPKEDSEIIELFEEEVYQPSLMCPSGMHALHRMQRR